MATENPTPERWLPVRGYEGLYEVSDLGRVRSLDRIVSGPRTWRGRILTPTLNNVGYLGVMLSDGIRGVVLRRVHRLVLDAFCRPPRPGEQANHRDFNKTNNRLENLEWTTPRENHAHAKAGGRIAHGEQNANAKLTEKAVLEIRARASRGESQRALATEYGISQSNVFRIASRKLWRHV